MSEEQDLDDLLNAQDAYNFIVESNAIEGIHREPTKEEIAEYYRFMSLEQVSIKDLVWFVNVYQPDARLRDEVGLNVRVGNYYPPKGGLLMPRLLKRILDAVDIFNAWETHTKYESLHPFTDCNGRSGRMLWMWQMKKAPLGFLHTFYYQTLAESKTTKPLDMGDADE